MQPFCKALKLILVFQFIWINLYKNLVYMKYKTKYLKAPITNLHKSNSSLHFRVLFLTFRTLSYSPCSMANSFQGIAVEL